MPHKFPNRRLKPTTGDDPAPSTTPTPDADVFNIPVRRPDWPSNTSRGYVYYLVFLESDGTTEVPDGTATVTPWIKDTGPGASPIADQWAFAGSDSGVAHRCLMTNYGPWVDDSDLFFQITALTGTDLDRVEIRMEVI